jgi:hypothetical protein
LCTYLFGDGVELKASAVRKEETSEKKRFSRFSGLVESMKKPAIFATMAVSFCACGPADKPTHDGGGGNDGGQALNDGGQSKDGGQGGDAGFDGGSAQALCDQFGAGSPNRVTFGLGDVKRPAENTVNYLMYFGDIVVANGVLKAEFPFYPSDLSKPFDWKGFAKDETRAVTIPSVGAVKFQLCDLTATPCSINIPGGTKTGDVNCTATLASEKPFAP